MKLVSEKAPHKSDVGGVVLNVADERACVKTFEHLMGLGKELGDSDPMVLLTSMIPKGIELFIGGKNDDYFGPALFFGAGGLLVELMHDVACKLAPLDLQGALELIDKTRISRVLQGYRGAKALDIASLADLLVKTSRFVASSSDLVELDLNPVILNSEEPQIADVRLIVQAS